MSRHSTTRMEIDTLQTLREQRERVSEALDEYIRQLGYAAQAGYMSKAEARSADVSRIQAESAQRVLWLD